MVHRTIICSGSVRSKFCRLIIFSDMLNPWIVAILITCLSTPWQSTVGIWIANYIHILDPFYQLSNWDRMQILNHTSFKYISMTEELTVTCEGILFKRRCLGFCHYDDWFCLTYITTVRVLTEWSLWHVPLVGRPALIMISCETPKAVKIMYIKRLLSCRNGLHGLCHAMFGKELIPISAAIFWINASFGRRSFVVSLAWSARQNLCWCLIHREWIAESFQS